MKFQPVAILLFSYLLYSCGNGTGKDKEDRREEIESMQETFYHHSEEKAPDVNEAKKLILAFKEYAHDFPESDYAPEYLYESASLTANVLQDYQGAIDIYEEVHEQYPDHEKAPVSLFTQGFLFENVLRDIPKAENKYQEFLNQYPDHELADDAHTSLDNLGKSPEEILNDILRRKKQGSPGDTTRP